MQIRAINKSIVGVCNNCCLIWVITWQINDYRDGAIMGSVYGGHLAVRIKDKQGLGRFKIMYLYI